MTPKDAWDLAQSVISGDFDDLDQCSGCDRLVPIQIMEDRQEAGCPHCGHYDPDEWEDED